MEIQTIEIAVEGMDCADCTAHVGRAISALPGVQDVQVYLASEKAVLQMAPDQVNMPAIQKAVESAGYRVRMQGEDAPEEHSSGDFTRSILGLLGMVFGAVLFIIVIGEWLGLFDAISGRIPWPVGLAVVLIGGYPVFLNVARAALNRQIIAHTLMTLGVVAALLVGEWVTAAVVVFFMRVGDYVESFTTERARRAVKDLAAMAPQTARVDVDGDERQIPVEQVNIGDLVIVRPGEMIPVDGQVLAGHAVIDQSAITGESLPVEAGPGARVYAATLAQGGHLRVRAAGVGADTTFGRVIKLVEEAEAHRADVQRIADKFSSWYLPLVSGIAALTFLIRRDPLATAAVLVVACSCAFALATPIAMLASIGAGARRGLMIKGGKYLEVLAGADVLLIDKTGTLTLGKPAIVDFRLLMDDWTELFQTSITNPQSQILSLAASAERYSEHPLAASLRQYAAEQAVQMAEPGDFEALPGLGVRAQVGGYQVAVGGRRMFPQIEDAPAICETADQLEDGGATTLFVEVNNRLVAVLAAADTLRPEVPAAIRSLQALGIRQIELLTGDNRRTAAALADDLVSALGVVDGDETLRFRAGLLPEDKIAIVKQYQANGHTVIMVGDGVNDAPALAQADVGIAMGAAGSDIAIEAAHIALMREDWGLVPEALRIARRTMAVVKLNIAFTAVYNLVGLSLAAIGILPPVLAAAAQSLPDIGILANSSRLLRQRD